MLVGQSPSLQRYFKTIEKVVTVPLMSSVVIPGNPSRVALMLCSSQSGDYTVSLSFQSTPGFGIYIAAKLLPVVIENSTLPGMAGLPWTISSAGASQVTYYEVIEMPPYDESKSPGG